MFQNEVILQLASSLDGYIAKDDGGVDFLNQENDQLNDAFHLFLDTIDVIVMGSHTYDKMLEFGAMPFKDKKIYVMTSKKYQEEFEHVTFLNLSVEEWMKQHHGRIWLFGGATLIQSFINQDLIDEYQIHIVPHIIGGGIPLFLNSNPVMNLELVNHQSFDDSITLTYKKQKS